MDVEVPKAAHATSHIHVDHDALQVQRLTPTGFLKMFILFGFAVLLCF